MSLNLLPKEEWEISFEGDVLVLKIEVTHDNYLHCRGYKLSNIGSNDNLPALDNLKGVRFVTDTSEA
mgnify:CR=1 FL=1